MATTSKNLRNPQKIARIPPVFPNENRRFHVFFRSNENAKYRKELRSLSGENPAFKRPAVQKGVEIRALKRAPAERARAFARICGPRRLSRKAYGRREASGVIFPFRPHRSQSPPGGAARNHPEATRSDLVAAAVNFDENKQKQTNSRSFQINSRPFQANSDAKTTLRSEGEESKKELFFSGLCRSIRLPEAPASLIFTNKTPAGAAAHRSPALLQ